MGHKLKPGGKRVRRALRGGSFGLGLGEGSWDSSLVLHSGDGWAKPKRLAETV